MFTAQVYKVQILCLSGIMEETYVAQEVIKKYNQENAEQTGKMFLLLDGDATACNADVVIGIVGNFIEKAEVVEQADKAEKKVLLFFSKYQAPENTIPSEQSNVFSFKEKMQDRSDCIDYNGKGDFAKILFEELEKVRSNRRIDQT